MSCGDKTQKKRLLPRATNADDGKIPVWNATLGKTVWLIVPGIGPIHASDVGEDNAGSVEAAINELYFQLSQAALLPIQSTDIADGITGSLETTLQLYNSNFETITENIDQLDANAVQEYYFGGTVQQAIDNLAGNAIQLPLNAYDVTDESNGYGSMQDAVNYLFDNTATLPISGYDVTDENNGYGSMQEAVDQLFSDLVDAATLPVSGYGVTDEINGYGTMQDAVNYLFDTDINADRVDVGGGQYLSDMLYAQGLISSYSVSTFSYGILEPALDDIFGDIYSIWNEISYIDGIASSLLDITNIVAGPSSPNYYPGAFEGSPLGEIFLDINNRLEALENAINP